MNGTVGALEIELGKRDHVRRGCQVSGSFEVAACITRHFLDDPGGSLSWCDTN